MDIHLGYYTLNLTENNAGVRITLENQTKFSGSLFSIQTEQYKIVERTSNHIVLIGKYASYRFKFKDYVPQLNKIRIEAWLFNLIPINIIFGEINLNEKELLKKAILTGHVSNSI